MMINMFSAISNAVLLVLHTLLKSHRYVLGLIASVLLAIGVALIAPLFIEINYSYPKPVCGVYWSYPYYARITGSNKLVLRAKDAGEDFVVKEGNYLITLEEPKNLDSNSKEKKVSIEFEVSPSSLWKIPPEKGLIKLETSNPTCAASLAIPLDWWTVILRFVGAIFTIVPATALIKFLFGK